MPQIWPMSWVLLFMFFLTCFIVFVTVLYFNIPLQPSSKQVESFKAPSLTWEW